MPNFDALRPAISGPLSYLCKPTAPAELLGCWPFYGATSDVSRYDNTFPLTVNSYVTNGNFKYATFTTSALGSLEALDLSGDWSLDFFRGPDSQSFDWTKFLRIELGEFNLVVNTLKVTAYDGMATDLRSGPRIGSHPDYPSLPSSPVHIAVTHQNGYVRVYTNGALWAAGSGSSSSDGPINFTGSVGQLGLTLFGSYTGSVANIRVVQKRLGTNSSFPVPSKPYTGYEAL